MALRCGFITVIAIVCFFGSTPSFGCYFTTDSGNGSNPCANFPRLRPYIKVYRPELLEAASRGDLAGIEQLLIEGADINATREDDGDTALIRAAKNNKCNAVRLLLDRRADPNGRGKDGWTALLWAAYDGDAEMVHLLIGYGANVDCQTNFGDTALIWAASKCNVGIVQTLLGHGASPHIKNMFFETARFWAREVDCDSAAAILS